MNPDDGSMSLRQLLDEISSKTLGSEKNSHIIILKLKEKE